MPFLTALLGSFVLTFAAALTGSKDLICSVGREGVLNDETSRSSIGAFAVTAVEYRILRVLLSRIARGIAALTSCKAISLDEY